VPYEAFPTKDGDILLGGGNDRLYGILCEKLGEPHWITDERFVTNEMRVKNRHILVPMIAGKTKEKTTQVFSLWPSGL
jgi:succinate--hydroxymethylglutarate CoA-transferase